MKYSVAFDIGVASVGMAVVDEDDNIVEAVSNLFSEADAASNVERRNFRGGRRLKRRQKTRINDFKKLWKESGFVIPDKLKIDTVVLRNKALNKKLSTDELYSVLLAMLKHRGISYLDDAIDESKGGNYAKAIAINQRELTEKYPCEIQLERLEKYGKYRGDITILLEGEEIHYSNVFTKSAYKNELLAIMDFQSSQNDKITKKFVEDYIKIWERKREYYIGPGNEKSRTDYGIYSTRKDENGNYVTDENIFEKLIGKCSVYPEEFRGAGASYTAQEFNLLNDLNNLIVNNVKLEEDEKRKIVEIVKSSNVVWSYVKI
ncbi:MAG: type II CRISPR RNA-guided endonuclease Cas9 [Lachnospiraceae bacterium]|nr:type II CRISPR RNA-guided endonuclease Cas9 [Lachnospiraceae bacterium]